MDYWNILSKSNSYCHISSYDEAISPEHCPTCQIRGNWEGAGLKEAAIVLSPKNYGYLGTLKT